VVSPVKVTTAEPELLALNVPENVPETESLPPVGAVWVMVRLKVPEMAMAPLPLTKI
jgi:hypothetical protein